MENLEGSLITNNDISISTFLLNLFLTLFLTKILSLIFNRYGKSISNRILFSNNFPLIGMTTMLIITIVKSSLALSLGLVGALSVVRFRTAIKEPEELSYLFFTIAIGLGFGANQTIITVIGFVLIAIFIYLSNLRKIKKVSTNFMSLLVSVNESNNYDVDKITNIIYENVSKLELKRLSSDSGELEILFKIEVDNYKNIINLKNNLKTNFQEININFLSNNIDLNI